MPLHASPISQRFLSGFAPVKSRSGLAPVGTPEAPPARFGADQVARIISGGTTGIPQGENPAGYVKDVAKSARDFYTPPPATGDYLKDLGSFVRHILTRGVETAVAPAAATYSLGKQFATDVVAPGSPGSYSGRLKSLSRQYGPATGVTAGTAEGLSKVGAAVATGIGAGQVVQGLTEKGIVPGLAVTEIQQLNLKDPNTDVQTLLKDHTDYHRRLGFSDEQPHISKYHDELSERIAEQFDLPRPVIERDFVKTFTEARRQYPGQFEEMPGIETKGPFRKTMGGSGVTKRTAAEQEALYRYEHTRTYTLDDQWDYFKKQATSDLRKVGASPEVISELKDLSRGGAGRPEFADRVLKNVDLPSSGEPVVRAWADETDIAWNVYRELKVTNGKMTPVKTSPAADLQKGFKSAGEIPQANQEVAGLFREAAELYEKEGASSFKVRAYQKAADTLETGGTFDVGELAKEVDTEVVIDAFKGQGIGRNIAEHIVDFFKTGTWPELESLRSVGGALPAVTGRSIQGLIKKLGR